MSLPGLQGKRSCLPCRALVIRMFRIFSGLGVFMNAWVAANQSHKVAVVSGTRTPFAKSGTKLKECSAVHLGVTVARQAMSAVNLVPEAVDEVVFGNAGTPADAANIGRVIALRSGIPEATPG